MTGLLLKDWSLLKNQGRYFLTIVILGFSMMFIGSDQFVAFGTSYLTFLFGIFVLSTISYDEFDNGMSFLMTLPVSRKTYVQEKFVFAFCLIIGAWVCTVLVCGFWIGFGSMGEELLSWCVIELSYLVMVLVFVALNLPIHMRFGAEKGKLIMFALVGAVMLVCIFLSKAAGVDMDAMLESVKRLFDVYAVPLLSGILLACILFIGVCYHISVKIMENREF